MNYKVRIMQITEEEVDSKTFRLQNFQVMSLEFGCQCYEFCIAELGTSNYLRYIPIVQFGLVWSC